MKRMKKFSITVIPIIIWVTLLLASIIVIFDTILTSVDEKVKDTELVLTSISSKVEYAINSKLLNLKTLEVLVNHNNGDPTFFEEQAPIIYNEDKSIRCIQIAPNGVITFVYPIEGNENSYGNLFVNELRKDEVKRAKVNREMTLGGPYELHQGGVGIVARYPIYLDQDIFWGFAIEVIDLINLLEYIDIDSLSDSGYSYRIWHNEISSGEPTIVYGDEKLPDTPLTTTIEIPGNNWYLSITPSDKWFNTQLLFNGLLIFFIFNLGSLLLVQFFINTIKSRNHLGKISQLDDLTGLYNIRAFYAKLSELEKKNQSFILYYLDLNKFKEVNDNYGHAAGNSLLITFTKRVKNLNYSPYFYRIGGDEFVIISTNTNNDDSLKFKDDVFSITQRPFLLEGLVLNISVSIGSAIYPNENAVTENVLRLAENRMYENKARASQPVALNSRKAFFNTLKTMIEKYTINNPNQNFYFYHLDFSNFSLINYTYGVHAGDDLIKRAVTFINKLPECLLCSRGYADWIFFVARSPSSMSREDVTNLFWKYYCAFMDKEQNNFPDIFISCHCGASKIVDADVEFAAGCASIARHISKKSYSSKPVFIDASDAENWMHSKYSESQILISFRDANYFYELQPIISQFDNKIVSAEALGRLRDSDGKIISPADFIPVLTKYNNIIQFDFAILDAVCHDLRVRMDNNATVIPISVNLSPLHLDNPNTAKRVKEIIDSHGIPTSLINIELTEDVLINDIQKPIDFCNEMHKIGVTVSLDDFGSGYLNFETLKDVPIDRLKIDKSLIDGITSGDSRGKVILSKIISIAHNLKTPLVCEGVETKEQCRWLKKHNVDYIQGFFYSKPQTPDNIYDKFLSK